MLDGGRPAARARRGRGAGRRDRARASRRCATCSTSSTGRRPGVRLGGVDLAAADPALGAGPGGARLPGGVPVRRRPCARTSRWASRWRTTDLRWALGGPGPTGSSATCPTGSTSSSASGASPSRAASASGWRWPGPCCAGRGCSCSTTPPPPSTPPSSARSSTACAADLHATTLIVAHRISTIALADRVAVPRRGRIAAAGTPRRAAGHRARVRGPGPRLRRGRRAMTATVDDTQGRAQTGAAPESTRATRRRPRRRAGRRPGAAAELMERTLPAGTVDGDDHCRSSAGRRMRRSRRRPGGRLAAGPRRRRHRRAAPGPGGHARAAPGHRRHAGHGAVLVGGEAGRAGADPADPRPRRAGRRRVPTRASSTRPARRSPRS